MKQKKYSSYFRIHDYEAPDEAELAKIAAEKKKVARLQKGSKEIAGEMARLEGGEDALVEELGKLEYEARKEAGNAATHKKRYKGLSADERFK